MKQNQQKLSSDSFPPPFQTAGCCTHQFRSAVQVPIRSADVCMSKIRRKHRQKTIHRLAPAIPVEQCLNGKAMTHVVETWASMSARRAQSDLSRKAQKDPVDMRAAQSGAAAGHKKVRQLRPGLQVREEVIAVFHECRKHLECGRVQGYQTRLAELRVLDGQN